ncbi:MAG: hypothetical protein DRZ82_08785 [Thermoprotei archaeon]|nr:MAG: hypothetical protein DRZ82_08785 [Thermoprotei archaeon]
MSDTHKVSVIVVTHNVSKHIVSCLRSVLGPRSVVIDKVIVVDNASSDGTVDLAEKHFSSDPKTEIIELRKNVGYPLACNIGVTHVNRSLPCL